MTTHEAKEILSLYRPGTADAKDHSFAEALQLCEQDAELRYWFDDHCAVFQALRVRLKHIPVPEGLREQILAEQKINTTSFWRQPRHRVLAASFSVVIAAILLFLQASHPNENTGFSGFRDRMVSKALRSYGMDLSSDNPERVQAFLNEQKSISNYDLPENLKIAKLVGCLATTWQGKPVSMICYQSGKPLRPGQNSDLWLFITENSSVADGPRTTTPTTVKIKSVTSASWSNNGKTYVLAVEGDEQLLNKFL